MREQREEFCLSWVVRRVQHEHQFEAGKFTQFMTVYYGAGEQEGQQGKHSEKDNICRSSYCGKEWAGNAVGV